MFTNDEMNLMCIYNIGTRTGLLGELIAMSVHLEPDETELAELTRSVTLKLRAMSDEEYTAIAEALMPDYEQE